jgi:hypothetical protein
MREPIGYIEAKKTAGPEPIDLPKTVISLKL